MLIKHGDIGKKVQIVNIYEVCFWNHENILTKIGCALSLESYLWDIKSLSPKKSEKWLIEKKELRVFLCVCVSITGKDREANFLSHVFGVLTIAEVFFRSRKKVKWGASSTQGQAVLSNCDLIGRYVGSG